MMTASFHSRPRYGEHAGAEAISSERSVWIRFENGDAEMTLFLPSEHPNAFEAAQTIALAFNSVVKPAVAKEQSSVLIAPPKNIDGVLLPAWFADNVVHQIRRGDPDTRAAFTMVAVHALTGEQYAEMETRIDAMMAKNAEVV